jgi:hypothetical protein
VAEVRLRSKRAEARSGARDVLSLLAFLVFLAATTLWSTPCLSALSAPPRLRGKFLEHAMVGHRETVSALSSPVAEVRLRSKRAEARSGARDVLSLLAFLVFLAATTLWSTPCLSALSAPPRTPR